MGTIVALAVSVGIVFLTVWLALRGIEMAEDHVVSGVRSVAPLMSALFVALVVFLATIGLLAVWTLCAPQVIGGVA